ncbi:MAG: hypothetical protein WBC33_11720 [Conexibacter sp.]
MKVRIGAAVAALAIAAFAAGCGSDTKAEEAEHAATPQQAIAEIAKVRSGLAEALATYQAGDESAADEQVGDTYLQHFEHVEGPLEEVDHELKEQLEDTIRGELRDEIKAGAGTAKVEALVREINAKLDEAETALGS